MEYTREQIINMILQHLKIRLSLDDLYDNYCKKKYHKKVIQYNKNKGALHFKNPYSLYGGLENEPLPNFILNK